MMSLLHGNMADRKPGQDQMLLQQERKTVLQYYLQNPEGGKCSELQISSQTSSCSAVRIKEETLFRADHNGCDQDPELHIFSQSSHCSPVRIKEETLFTADQNDCDQGPELHISSQSSSRSPLMIKEEPLFTADEDGCNQSLELQISPSQSPTCSPMTDEEETLIISDENGYIVDKLVMTSQPSTYGKDSSSLTEKTCGASQRKESKLQKSRHRRGHMAEKPFECTWCDYRCSQKGDLTSHVRTHTGGKLFKCILCDYGSRQKGALAVHIRSHMGEKPFKCTICDYRCTCKEKLHIEKHMRTHTGEKPFVCNFCDYRCSQRSILTRHMRKHTELGKEADAVSKDPHFTEVASSQGSSNGDDICMNDPVGSDKESIINSSDGEYVRPSENSDDDSDCPVEYPLQYPLDGLKSSPQNLTVGKSHSKSSPSSEVQDRTISCIQDMTLPVCPRTNLSKTSWQSENDVTATESITVMTTNNEGGRKYDKQYFCLYCSKPQCKLPRHLEALHKEEKEVAMYLAETDKSLKEQMLVKIRNLGNHHHNVSVIRSKRGQLVVAYRPPPSTSSPVEWRDYVPCEHCYAYFVSWDLWKHVRRCVLAPEDRPKHARVVQNSRLLLPAPQGTSVGLNSVLISLKSDEISGIVKSDLLIKQFGEKLYLKNGHDSEMYSYIRTKLRELGRLLLQLRKNSGQSDASLRDFINPLLFRSVLLAAKDVAGFCDTSHKFSIPALALKLGHSLKKCAKLVRRNALEMGDAALLDQASRFSNLCQKEWTAEISCHALHTLQGNKQNKVQLLPLTSDVSLLTKYLKETGNNAFNNLRMNSSSTENWCVLAETALTQVILFNRGRQGDASKMKILNYEGTHPSQQEDILEFLTPLEKKLSKVLKRIEVVGKRSRTVPILLTPKLEKWISLLMTTREQVGVHPDNVFVFACPHYGSLGRFRGSVCFKKASEKCGASCPHILRSGKLRKQIGTMSQIINLRDNELDVLADFLGHDTGVHREFYRLPQETMQVAKVSKLLLAMESGRIMEQTGLNLDTMDIQPEEELDVDLVENTQADDQDSDDDDSDQESSPRAQRQKKSACAKVSQNSNKQNKREDPEIHGSSRAKAVKRPWTDVERMAVYTHFENHIGLNRLPGKREIDACKQSEPALSGRSWKHIKDFIRNRMKSSKSRKLV